MTLTGAVPAASRQRAGDGGRRRPGGAPLLALALLAALSPEARGQVPRELLRSDLERDRRNLRAYVAAMPDSLLSFRPTPGVRTFAEQIEHAVVDAVNIVSTAVRGDTLDWRRAAGPGDLADREALLELVDRGYAVLLRLLDETPDHALEAPARVFGRYHVPRWRAFQAAREHGTWTLGQTVPYLRLNGITPPTYEVFPPSSIRPR